MTMLTLVAHILPSAVTAPRIHIDFLWMLVILFGSVGVAYLVITFVLKRRLTRKEKMTIVLKKDIAPLLSTLLYNTNEGSREEGEDVMNAMVHLKEMLKNPAHRKKISEILIDIRTDLPDETRQRIHSMYQDFGLHEDAIQRLQNWRWEEVCRGIHELTQMQVTGAYMYIRRYINDSRSIVRKQAQLAMVALKPEGIVYFLDHARHAISEWQQLKILETLQELPDFTPPRFRLWLTSKNQHVVLFAMRLIRSFDQDDAMESILKLVKHRDDTVKVEAINCIREFEYREALPLLKRIFPNCRSEVKLALLSAIGEMGEEKDIPFLHYVEQHATDHVIKSKAISTINALAPETILPSDQINESLAEGDFDLDHKPAEDVGESKIPGRDEFAPDRFQLPIHAPEFSKYRERIADDERVTDWISQKGILEIRVVAEELPMEHTDGTVAIRDSDGPTDETLGPDAPKTPKTPARPSPEKMDKLSAYHTQADTCPVPYDPEMSEILDQKEHELNESIIGNPYEAVETEDEKRALENVEAARRILNAVQEETGTKGSDEPQQRSYHSTSREPGYLQPDFKLGSASYARESADQWQESIWDHPGGSMMEEEGQNGFEQVFQYLSEDMKLSVLADILQLGDKRDLIFLRKLGRDRSERVRRKARHIFEMLSFREQQSTVESDGSGMYVDSSLTLEELAFEIDMELPPGLFPSEGPGSAMVRDHQLQTVAYNPYNEKPVKHRNG